MRNRERTPEDFAEGKKAVHRRALASSRQFGRYAANSSNTGVTPLSVSAPRPTDHGEVVVTNFQTTRQIERAGGAGECLITLKPNVSARLGPGLLTHFLAAKLSPFCRSQLVVSDERSFLGSLNQTSARPTVLRVDGRALEGWTLDGTEGRGVVAQHDGVVFMWLGVLGSTPPLDIFTTDLGAHVHAIVGPPS